MKIIFSLIIFSLFLWSKTLNQQIHALENATAKERVELMNHIKEQLISMNESKRTEVLRVLKSKLHPKEQDSSILSYKHLRRNQKYSHQYENQDRIKLCDIEQYSHTNEEERNQQSCQDNRNQNNGNK